MEQLKDMHLLGLKVRDRVTGFEGVVASVCYDLYGCIQAVVSPAVKDGELKDGRWFDVKRLEVLDTVPVMELPDFAVSSPKPVIGAQEKTLPRGI